MRSAIVFALLALVSSAASAEVKGLASPARGLSQTSREALRLVSTNLVYQPRRSRRVVYAGVVAQAAKSRNPLQLINPFAPVSAGTAEASTARDPISGRASGINLLSVGF